METLLSRYPQLKPCQPQLEAALAALIHCYTAGGKFLLCGNGGSSADCEHIVGELMKGFLKKRPLTEAQKSAMLAAAPDLDPDTLCKLQGALPAVALSSGTGLNTAFCNDVDPNLVYAQGVMGLGKAGDVLLCISTSGNAKNTFAAAQVAKGLGLTVIGLTGATGGALKQVADICICAPETETYKVQELHLPIYHYLCAAVEAHFFAE